MKPLLLRAVAGEELDRPPVWMMRQAGRTLEEYRNLRAKHTFSELCRDPDLAVEVSLQPWRAFAMDGVILFADILTPFDALGLGFELDHKGPRIPDPIRSAEDVRALRPRDPREAVPWVFEALRRLRAEVDGRATLLGFCGAPFTLASYAIEGQGTKTFDRIRTFAYHEPDAFHALLDLLAEEMGRYLAAQVEAGAEVVQVFDTWAGELAREELLEWSLPYAQRVLRAAADAGARTIFYIKGATGWLESLRDVDADVIGLDWRVPMDEARRRLGAERAVQGNLDPGVLLSDPETVRARTHAVIRAAGPRGHVLNLGHGVLPMTPRENLAAFFDAARSFSWRDEPAR